MNKPETLKFFFWILLSTILIGSSDAQEVPLEFGKLRKKAKFKHFPNLHGVVDLDTLQSGNHRMLFHAALRNRRDSLAVTLVETDAFFNPISIGDLTFVQFDTLHSALEPSQKHLFFPNDSMLNIVHIDLHQRLSGTRIRLNLARNERIIAFFEWKGKPWRLSRNLETLKILITEMVPGGERRLEFAQGLPIALFDKKLRFSAPVVGMESDGEQAARRGKIIVEKEGLVILLDTRSTPESPITETWILRFDLDKETVNPKKIMPPAAATSARKSQSASLLSSGKLFQVWKTDAACIIRITEPESGNVLFEKITNPGDPLDYLSSPFNMPGASYFEAATTVPSGKSLIESLEDFDLFIQPRKWQDIWVLHIGGWKSPGFGRKPLHALILEKINRFDAFALQGSAWVGGQSTSVSYLNTASDRDRFRVRTGIWNNRKSYGAFYVCWSEKTKTVTALKFPRTLIDRCGKMLEVVRAEERFALESVFFGRDGYYLGRYVPGFRHYLFKKIRDF